MKKKADRVYKRLLKAHPKANIELKFSNPLELLVATILSAQCTDTRVNSVTTHLFKKYKKPQDYLARPASQLEEDIHSTGFFRQKAKSIRGVMKDLIEKHSGKVPDNMDDLVRLPGVGRKTANVILGNIFGIPGIVVDTHVSRVSKRIGFTKEKNPEKIESDLSEIFSKSKWSYLSHLLISHGRNICKARKPLCDDCSITDLCIKNL